MYDAENRLTCVVDPNGGSCTTSGATVYYYDAGGRRVAKYTGAGAVIEEYVYDLKGDQSTVHDGSGNLLRAELHDPDGRHVATLKNGALTYNLADGLGTERVRTNGSGTVTETCTDTPYGMNMACGGTDPSPMHFTGKQLDSETGNTHFDARELATGSNLRRWMTPDWSDAGSPVPYAKLDNPQTLNLYAYLRNNPLNSVDPDGHGADGTPNPATDKPCTDYGCQGEKRNLMGNPATPNPVNSVTILGQKVDVTYAPGMSEKDQMAASQGISNTATLINANADKLSSDEKAAISNIKTINVDPTASRSSTDVKTGVFTVTLAQVAQPSARFASDIAHDGYHVTQFKSGRPFTGGPAEREATNFQIPVARKLGLDKENIDFLQNYADHIEDHEDYWSSPVTHSP